MGSLSMHYAVRLALIVSLGFDIAALNSCRKSVNVAGITETSRSSHQAPASAQSPETRIGLQYETYFTPLNTNWGATGANGIAVSLQNGTEEAIPILGNYSSLDTKILRQHEQWLEDMGVDWLLLDWSNMLLMKPLWEDDRGATHELVESTDLLFKTYSKLQKEGRNPPKLVIMLGLAGGLSGKSPIQRLNGLIAWMKNNLLDKAEYKNLWLYYNGKPLMTILFIPKLTCQELAEQTRGLVARDWTVRWMGSQLDDSHVDQCGFWSWMDGTIQQVATYRDGAAEATVVTPACFPLSFALQGDNTKKRGWLDPRATGRDHGVPFLESWKVAFATRPKFIQIHQWNEFAGQKDGTGGGPQHDIYGDEYSLDLSDDLEPTQMDKCGYRGCGGWGYYYFNLTRALISLYRGETPDISVMALSGPPQTAIEKEKSLALNWEVLGKPPSSYTLKVDGQTVAEAIDGSRYRLDVSRLSPGQHRATLIANGAHTYFDLAPEKLAMKSSTPLPVTSTVTFTLPLHGAK